MNGAGGNVGRGEPVIALEGPGLVDIEQAIEVVVADRADQLEPEQSLSRRFERVTLPSFSIVKV